MQFLTRGAAALTVIGTLAVTAPTAAAQADNDRLKKLRGSIEIDGSSTVYPITEAVAEAFREVAPNVRVTVGISGTGGGFKRFTKGETVISDASRPIKAKERDLAAKNGVEFIEVPVAYDGLSIVVNKANTAVNDITVDELKKIFLEGTNAKTWADVRPGWPDSPITIYMPGTDSGTFDYFKEVVAGKKGSIRSDLQTAENDNVLVNGVVGDKDAIGYFGCAYYFANADKLKIVPVLNPATNTIVEPTAETIENGSYAPFSRPLFIYVNAEDLRKRDVQAFVAFYLDHAAEMASGVGYVGLPQSIYDIARSNVRNRKTGTHFLDENGESRHGAVTTLYTE